MQWLPLSCQSLPVLVVRSANIHVSYEIPHLGFHPLKVPSGLMGLPLRVLSLKLFSGVMGLIMIDLLCWVSCGRLDDSLGFIKPRPFVNLGSWISGDSVDKIPSVVCTWARRPVSASPLEVDACLSWFQFVFGLHMGT